MSAATRLALTTLLAGLLLVLPLAAQAPAEPPSGRIHGTVRGSFQERAVTLGFATVEAGSGARRWFVTADAEGRYEIRSLAPGEVRIRASHPGYETLNLIVTVPAGGNVGVDLELTADPILLPRVAVVGDPVLAEPERRDPDVSTPLPELELQALDLAPGVGQAGLLDAVRALPGNDPADATDVLFMRGSTTDLKLVLLDGVPVYTPFHVAGLMRSFEPTVLGSAQLHVGGAPARYDGGLTHILELRTRRARRDRMRASGSVDLLAASIAVETPLGERAGLIASARSLHDLGRAPLGGRRPYGYRDVLFAIDAEPSNGQELTATGFWNAESVLLDYSPRSDDARWSNLAGSLGYARPLGAGARLQISAGLSGYRARLPLLPSVSPPQSLPDALLATAETDRGRAMVELTLGPPSAPIRTGVSFERIDARFGARNQDGSAAVETHGSSTGAGAFVDLTRPLGADLTLRAGLRADRFSGGFNGVAPRAALLWEVGPDALLTVAAGRYHQPTRAPDAEVERTLAAVVDDTLTSGELLPVATADHVVLSLDQRLGGRVALGLEGFWKRYEGLADSRGETVRSSGIDVRVLSAGARGTGWLGYELSWFWSTQDLSGHASSFAGRHLLTGGLSGRLVGPLSGEARIAYGAGLPYTSIPFRSVGAEQDALSGSPEPAVGGGGQETSGSPLVGGLDEEFLRVDVEIQALFQPRWGGRVWRIRPYLRVLNALDQRDALFYTFQPWRSDSLTPLAERPFLPLLGIAFSF